MQTYFEYYKIYLLQRRNHRSDFECNYLEYVLHMQHPTMDVEHELLHFLIKLFFPRPYGPPKLVLVLVFGISVIWR